MSAVGTCALMCPRKEADLRTRSKRLSIFEKNGMLVKEYARCAAGSTRTTDELRTTQALQRSTNHLISLLDVKLHGYNWIDTTNFVTDRLRAVRQDVIIQQLPWHIAVPILEKIVRYHIFVQFLLHRKSIQQFDPALNDQLLKSYMGDLFEYYGGVETKRQLDCYDEFQSYRLLLNLTNEQFLGDKMAELATEGVALNFRQPETRLAHACCLCLHYHGRRFLRFFRELSSKATFLESCCLLYHTSSVRAAFLSVLSHGFCNKHFSFPTERLASWLYFDTSEHLKLFLEHFHLPYDDQSVFFREKKQYVLNTGQERQDIAKQCTYQKLVDCKIDDCFDAVCIVNGEWLFDNET